MRLGKHKKIQKKKKKPKNYNFHRHWEPKIWNSYSWTHTSVINIKNILYFLNIYNPLQMLQHRQNLIYHERDEQKKYKPFSLFTAYFRLKKKKTGAFLQASRKTACYVNSAGENICSLLSHAHLCCCQETVQAALGMASLCYRKRVKYFTKIQNYYDWNTVLHFET